MTILTRHLSQVSEAMTLLDVEEIESVIRILKLTRHLGGTVWVFGNGGSHATAGHFANDLMKMARLKAVCVGDMASSMLAYGNDEGWGRMYAGPLDKLLKPNDCVVGISCSGSSANVIAALNLARSRKYLAIGLTGLGNGSVINTLNLDGLIHVRSEDIRVQEDLHLMVCHAIARSLQEES